MLLDFEIYYKAKVNKTVWYWHKTLAQKQTNGQLIYNKGASMYNGEKTPSLVNSAGKTEQLHAKESIWIAFSHHTRVHSK